MSIFNLVLFFPCLESARCSLFFLSGFQLKFAEISFVCFCFFFLLIWTNGLLECLILRTFAGNLLWELDRPAGKLHSLLLNKNAQIGSFSGQGMVCFYWISVHSSLFPSCFSEGHFIILVLLFHGVRQLYIHTELLYVNTHTGSCLLLATKQLSWNSVGLRASLGAFRQQCIHK